MGFLSFFWFLWAIRVSYVHHIIKHWLEAGAGIEGDDIVKKPWSRTLIKILASQCISTGRRIRNSDITCRMKRIDNYMSALYKCSTFDVDGRFYSPLFFTEYCTNTLRNILFSDSHDWYGEKNPFSEEWKKKLRSRFIRFGVLFLIASPVFFLVQLLLIAVDMAALIKKDPSSLVEGGYWNTRAKWTFRLLNEMPHELEHRMDKSAPVIQSYISMFPLHYAFVEIAKFVRVCGGVLFLILLIYSFVASQFIFEIFGVSSALVMTAVSLVVVVSHSLVIPQPHESDLKKKLKEASETLQYGEKKWLDEPGSDKTFKAIKSLFEKRFILLLKEVMAPLAFPFILLHLSKKDELRRIVMFLRRNSEKHSFTGWVLKESYFSEDGKADGKNSPKTADSDDGDDSDGDDYDDGDDDDDDYHPIDDHERELESLDAKIGDYSGKMDDFKVSSMISFALRHNNDDAMKRSRPDLFWDPMKNKFLMKYFRSEYESPVHDSSTETQKESAEETQSQGSSTTGHVSSTYSSKVVSGTVLDSEREEAPEIDTGFMMLSLNGVGFDKSDRVSHQVMQALNFHSAKH